MSKSIQHAGAAALALALVTAGATAVQSSSSAAAVVKAAETDASNASRALAKARPEAAIRYAEHAVQLRPQDATYRALLGKAYLASGRFFSAKQAFADALQLDSGLPGVALNLALTSIATGDFAAAQGVLQTHSGSISPADLGLAVALAGDPAGAVGILLPAARAAGSDAKTRQNLALAFALAGRWPEARQVAITDLSPADADARIVQWAAFARPTNASDQVAALLGVVPVADSGQPVQLALTSSAPMLAEATPAPLDTGLATAPTPLPVPISAPAALVAPTEVAAAAPRPAVGKVTFGDRREVVQVLPAAPVRPVVAKVDTKVAVPVAAKPDPVVAKVTPAPVVAKVSAPVRPAAVKVAAAPVRPTAKPATVPTPAKGNYFVQIGAFNSGAMAKVGWDRASKRFKVLSGKTPYTMPIGNGLTRVAVGGFDRSNARTMCRTIKAKGGDCFVRSGAGDQVASWVKKNNVQFAAAKAPRGRPSKRG